MAFAGSDATSPIWPTPARRSQIQQPLLHSAPDARAEWTKEKGSRSHISDPDVFFKLLLRFFSTNDCGNLGSRNLFSSVPEQSNGLSESKGWGASTCEVTNIWRARTSTADQGRIPRIWHLDSSPIGDPLERLGSCMFFFFCMNPFIQKIMNNIIMIILIQLQYVYI